MKHRPLRFKIMVVKVCIVVAPVVLVLLLLHIFLPSITQGYKQKHFTGPTNQWETEHFRFLSTQFADAKDTSILVENYRKAFYATFSDRFKIGAFSRKPEIFIFRDRTEFRRYHYGKTWSDLPNNSAYYSPMDNKVIMYYSSDIERTLYHELTHLIMDLGIGVDDPQWSCWFSEGIAVYCEIAQLANGKIVPARLDASMLGEVKRAWKEGEQITPARLMRASPNDFRGKQSFLYYYGSYLMVYFLLHGEDGKYGEKFYRYFHQERKSGPCPSSVFWDIMGETPGEFTQKFHSFLKNHW
jgi:hypothetical protein